MDESACWVIFMLLLKLLAFKWSGCDLTLSTFSQPRAAVRRNCQAQSLLHHCLVIKKHRLKNSSNFNFYWSQTREGGYFCKGVVFSPWLWRDQDAKSRVWVVLLEPVPPADQKTPRRRPSKLIFLPDAALLVWIWCLSADFRRKKSA